MEPGIELSTFGEKTPLSYLNITPHRLQAMACYFTLFQVVFAYQ